MKNLYLTFCLVILITALAITGCNQKKQAQAAVTKIQWSYSPAGDFPAAPQYVTNIIPPVPGATNLAARIVRLAPRPPTNWLASLILWDQPITNSVTIQYEVHGGCADNLTNFDFTCSSSNNSVAIMKLPSGRPTWIAVRVGGPGGYWTPWSTNLYLNVPVWPQICAYTLGGKPYVGWMGSNGHADSVQYIGGAGLAYIVSPSSNALLQAPLIAPMARVLRQ